MIKQQTARHWTAFWFPPATDSWLTILRVGLAIQIILYCFSLRVDWFRLFARFGGNALLGRELSEIAASSDSPFIPRLGWLIELGTRFGIDETTTLWLVWTLLVVGSLLLAIGLFSRTAAVVVWFLHLCSVKSGVLLTYGMDDFTTIGAFYLMVSPLPDHYSLDRRWRGTPTKAPEIHGFFRRILQLHLCIAYFFGGVAKACGAGWWNGDSIWRSLTQPPFDVITPEILVRFKAIFPLAGIFVCLLELGYPIFIWCRPTRMVWLTGVIIMHVAIGLTMGMYLFAIILIVLNLAAFGPGAASPWNFVRDYAANAQRACQSFRRRQLEST